MHGPSNCTLLHPEKKSPSNPPKKKTAPRKLTFAEAAIAVMEAEEQENGNLELENKA
jgi:hypothetical protein